MVCNGLLHGNRKSFFIGTLLSLLNDGYIENSNAYLFCVISVVLVIILFSIVFNQLIKNGREIQECDIICSFEHLKTKRILGYVNVFFTRILFSKYKKDERILRAIMTTRQTGNVVNLRK